LATKFHSSVPVVTNDKEVSGLLSQLKVIRNNDGTITVKVGRAVEHISTAGKEKGQVFDAVKYAAMSKGVNLTDVSLTEILHDYN
jgi:hypothetical protein